MNVGDRLNKLAAVMRPLLLIPFLLSLASCALLSPSRNGDVSGDLRGFSESQHETPLVLFLSDAQGNGAITPDTVEIGRARARSYYALDLPASLKKQSGDYRVTVGVDANRNRFCSLCFALREYRFHPGEGLGVDPCPSLELLAVHLQRLLQSFVAHLPSLTAHFRRRSS